MQNLSGVAEVIAQNEWDDSITIRKLKPDFVEANYNLSLIKLLKSNYLEGWKHYEWRKKRSSFKMIFTLKN